MKRLLFATTIALAAAGCGPTSGPVVGPPSLAGVTEIAALEPSAQSRITVTARGGLAGAKTVDLPVQAIDLRVRSGEHPVLEAVDLALADTDVSPDALPPHGLKLRNLHLYVEHEVPAYVKVAEDDRLEVSAEAPLVLKWALALDDGTLWPLGPTKTVPLALDVRAVRSGTTTTVSLEARCAGTCWSVDGVGDLDDGVISAQASAEVTGQ